MRRCPRFSKFIFFHEFSELAREEELEKKKKKNTQGVKTWGSYHMTP